MSTRATPIPRVQSRRSPYARTPSGRPQSVRPVARLDSIGITRSRPPTQQRRSTKQQTNQCKNPDCDSGDVIEDEGKLICQNCGFVLQEVQITQELTFGEASNGAAVVQGKYVGANDESARNPALGSSKVAGGMDSRQITERNGRLGLNMQLETCS